MNKEKIIEQILKLKKERGAIILAHNYQRPEIYEVADFVGDSFELSKKARDCSENLIVFCGVKFMAETAKILSPEKKVLIPEIDAGCPMADMITVEALKKFKSEHPNAKVVSYVNTNADTKTETDVCCTSANAEKIVASVDADEILFVPDRNLASFVQRTTDKKIIPWNGCCPTHNRVSPELISKLKEKHPEAIVIGHPECRSEVIDLCDYALSTGGMVKFVRENSNKQIIVVTEDRMINRLRQENSSNEYIAVGMTCPNMQKTKLESVLIALEDDIYEIKLPEDVIDKAEASIKKMVDVGSK